MRDNIAGRTYIPAIITRGLRVRCSSQQRRPLPVSWGRRGEEQCLCIQLENDRPRSSGRSTPGRMEHGSIPKEYQRLKAARFSRLRVVALRSAILFGGYTPI